MMDDFSQGGEPLREALRHLRRLNRIFGASGPVLYGVKRLWNRSGRPDSLTILDVGSGSGDLNRRILKWADRQGVKLSVILADVSEESRMEAECLYQDEPRVTFVERNVFDLSDHELRADIVTASQFAHHFPSERLPLLVERMLAVSRLGLVIHDIHRHWMPWAAVWLAARMVSRNPYIRHDGPLSVAKGFRGSDFRLLAERLGDTRMTYRWRPLFRYAVIVPKQREADRHGEGI